MVSLRLVPVSGNAIQVPVVPEWIFQVVGNKLFPYMGVGGI